MNPEMDEDPRNFLDVVAATDPWLPPHPLITQPESASFRPLPLMAPPIIRCTPVYTLDQTRDISTLIVYMALLSMVFQ